MSLWVDRVESQRRVSRWRDRGQSVRGQGLQSVHQHVISHCTGMGQGSEGILYRNVHIAGHGTVQ